MLYNKIVSQKKSNEKLLAILLDPDKVSMEQVYGLCEKINSSPATHIFVGGSSFNGTHLDKLILELKAKIKLPVLLFPGNASQISNEADGILFLTLLSGRNPDYLIEHQINAVPILKKTDLEVISTGYILIESGSETAVELVSKTKPLDRNNADYVLQTAQAGEWRSLNGGDSYNAANAVGWAGGAPGMMGGGSNTPVVATVDEMIKSQGPVRDINDVRIDVVPDFSKLMGALKEKGSI